MSHNTIKWLVIGFVCICIGSGVLSLLPKFGMGEWPSRFISMAVVFVCALIGGRIYPKEVNG